MNREYFSMLLSREGLALDDMQLGQFELYLGELLEWNKKFNLTAIKEEEEIVTKHFYDSLLGMKGASWEKSGSLLDMGSGAGFPGVPLKILNPALEVVLVDSLQKRIGFLEHIITELKLENIKALHARAEDLGRDRQHREKYDVVVSRAVAKMPVLCEYCLPLVATGGIFVAYKGPEGEGECLEARNAIAVLGGRPEEIITHLLPDGSKRTLIYIRKEKTTPAHYPRKTGTPAKKPL